MTGADDPAAEARLAERAAAGDRAALRELYLLHREAALRVAFRYLGDEAEARAKTAELLAAVQRFAKTR